MVKQSHKTLTKYHYFFYPEIKEYLDNKELIEVENFFKKEGINTSFDYFDNKRKTGENEQYICDLIRKDSVEEFISYVNKINLPLNSKVKTSIFESNPFLIKNESTLIEYASFYGSIQIVNYLRFNNAEMEPTLWLYAIHGQNPDIIHLLEEYSVDPPSQTNQSLFDESVKCHHKNFANYFKDIDYESNINNYKNIFKSYNYEQMKNIVFDSSVFYYMCRYNYSKLVELYLENKHNDIKYLIISY